MILKEDVDINTLVTPYFPDGRLGFPSYVLVDRNGKEVARGKAAALAAAKKDAS